MALKKAASKSRKSSTASKVGKAEKEAQKAEIERLKNTREFPELAGLLAVAPYKALASPAWLNNRLPPGETPLEKATKKEKDRFVLAVVRKGSAQQVIHELKNAPAERWKQFMVDASRMSEKKASEAIRALKPKDFAALCETYAIEPIRGGKKQSISKPKTLPRILAEVERVREHLKL